MDDSEGDLAGGVAGDLDDGLAARLELDAGLVLDGLAAAAGIINKALINNTPTIFIEIATTNASNNTNMAFNHFTG